MPVAPEAKQKECNRMDILADKNNYRLRNMNPHPRCRTNSEGRNNIK